MILYSNYKAVLLSFIFLSAVILIWAVLTTYLKGWDSIYSVFLLFLITTFWAPVLYFGWFESVYLTRSVVYTGLVGTSVALFLMTCYYLLIKWRKLTEAGVVKLTTVDKSIGVGLSLGSFVVLLVWMAMNFKNLPLYGWITGEKIFRPDIEPTIPFFYSFSSYLYFVVPLILLNYKDAMKAKVYYLLVAVCCVLLASGGHRSILVFYLLFHWWFVWGKRIDWKVLFVGVISVAVSILNTKATKGTQLTLSDAVYYGLKRFFVEQGRGLPARFDLVAENHKFVDNIPIKSQVASHYWGGSSSTMPTFFFGDFYVLYGMVGGVLLTLIVMTLLIGMMNSLRLYEDTLTYKWMFFAVIMLLFQADVSIPSVCRMSLVLGMGVLLLSSPYETVR